MLELLTLIQPLLTSGADLAMIVFLWVVWKLDRRLVKLEVHWADFMKMMNGKKKR